MRFELTEKFLRVLSEDTRELVLSRLIDKAYKAMQENKPGAYQYHIWLVTWKVQFISGFGLCLVL